MRHGEVRGEQPKVVDVDKAAEEPADQEPLDKPAEDKEAELDAKKRALDERERDVHSKTTRLVNVQVTDDTQVTCYAKC